MRRPLNHGPVTKTSLRTPKRSSETEPRLFGYYAGYSSGFVQDVLVRLELPPGSELLDPWNGSATTTLVAERAGHRATGYDLNPAMVVLARAAHVRDFSGHHLVRAAKQVLHAITLRPIDRSVRPDDPLLRWFGEGSICLLRSLAAAIASRSGRGQALDPDALAALPPRDALLYVVLFRVVRDFLSRFRTTNPTWLRAARRDEARQGVSRATIEERFLTEAARVAEFAGSQGHTAYPPRLELGDARSLPLPNSSIDAVVSSPPYCTRLDYGIATLPELALLGCNSESVFKTLRLQLMGATLSPEHHCPPRSAWGKKALGILTTVAKHSSKASPSYYLRFLLQYIESLYRSFLEIGRVTRSHGKVVLVLQSSFYKEHTIDLPGIAIDMLESMQFSLVDRINFDVPAPLASIHRHRARYRTCSGATEVALILSKART